MESRKISPSCVAQVPSPQECSVSHPSFLLETAGGIAQLLHPMQAVQFEQSVAAILKRDRRFDPGAYFFLKDALDFTLKRISETNDGRSRHVSGPELLLGFRDHALEQYGPMASTLMNEWGLRKCQDVGDMVFHLIEEQVFGKQESDRREDFSEVFDFQEALILPFLPKKRSHTPRKQAHAQRAVG